MAAAAAAAVTQAEPAMAIQPPFAMFVLSGDIDAEYISESLRRAWRGNFMAGWDFWVATERYTDMPRAAACEGTVAPLSAGFSSPWIGKTLRECARWLTTAPTESAVNRKYFTAIDSTSKGNDAVLVCRVAQSPKTGDVEVEYFPQPTDLVALRMVTNTDAAFDRRATAYRHDSNRDVTPRV